MMSYSNMSEIEFWQTWWENDAAGPKKVTRSRSIIRQLPVNNGR
jgi:hypothetical protein